MPLAHFGHHDDLACDFEKEVADLEAMAFDRRIGVSAAAGLEDRIRRAMNTDIGDDDIALLARAALRELEAEFLRCEIFARRRALAQQDRIMREWSNVVVWC